MLIRNIFTNFLNLCVLVLNYLGTVLAVKSECWFHHIKIRSDFMSMPDSASRGPR